MLFKPVSYSNALIVSVISATATDVCTVSLFRLFLQTCEVY